MINPKIKDKSDKNGAWIVLVGGGTGGHVVPLKNIAEQIFKKNVNSKILVITDKGYKERAEQIFSDLSNVHKDNLVIKHVVGGRFRRYSRSKIRELADIRTQVLNIRDLFKSLYGVIQSKLLTLRYKPEVIFCKGGTGALEYCFANRKKAPIIVHDSDSRPGLANKTVGRWAVKVLTGMPRSVAEAEDPSISKTLVGVPVNADFKAVSKKTALKIKDQLLIDQKFKTVLVTGGSLGAKRVNELIFCTIGDLNKLNIQVIHQTGLKDDLKKAKEIKRTIKYPKLYKPFDFTTQMPELYAVSDLVVSRAGATAIQELANSGKPAILIPAGLSDQKKNGQILDELGAAMVADQNSLLNHPDEFIKEVQFLLNDDKRREEFSERISTLAKFDTIDRIVDELLNLKGNKSNN